MRFAILFVISSFFIGCAGGPARPNSYIWGVNAPAQRLEGYNIKTDFDDDGNLLPNAQAQFMSLTSIRQLNVAWVIFPGNKPGDPLKDEGQAGIKRYIGELRRYARERCQ